MGGGRRAGWSQVAGNGAALSGRAGGVVGDHPRGFPVSGEHHVGSRRPAGGELARQTYPSGVGGHAALEAGGPGRGRKPHSPIIFGESGTTRPAGAGAAAARSRADGAGGAVLEVADIVGLAGLVRLAAADGDEDAVAGVLYVRPAQRGDFRPPRR